MGSGGEASAADQADGFTDFDVLAVVNKHP
jgi:hypothetical protein